jgi:hypothetical protein
MPAGTSRAAPPAALPVTPLLAAWWPRPDLRWSLHGRSSRRRPWKEPDIRAYASWDRRQRRSAALAVSGTLFFGFALVTAIGIVTGTGGWTADDLIIFGPPVVAALVISFRGAFRG